MEGRNLASIPHHGTRYSFCEEKDQSKTPSKVSATSPVKKMTSAKNISAVSENKLVKTMTSAKKFSAVSKKRPGKKMTSATKKSSTKAHQSVKRNWRRKHNLSI
jgi:hypothetical protein